MSKISFVKAGRHEIDLEAFREELMKWGREHFRPFPWRLTGEPYHILVAEMMLHRTQVLQVVPVYERFILRYPGVASLAQTTKEELYRILYPLGLHWRINSIHEMASELVKRFSGQVPHAREDLLSLPGVNQYIAGAVRCFAWNLPEPLIDTNIMRVMGRLFGLEVKDSFRRNRCFWELIASLVDPFEPRSYNYALLDLAQEVCRKTKPPECRRCPVRRWCAIAKQLDNGNVQQPTNLADISPFPCQ